MSVSVESHCIFNNQILDSMDSCNSGERVVYCVSDRIRTLNISVHMEMDGVTADDLGLSGPIEFCVRNTPLCS
jgi:hypothetical protein